MLNKNTKIKVRNRSAGKVGYSVPDLGILNRVFMANEVKDLSFEEIQKLAYQPGGSYILQHYLVIDNQEAREEILGDVELEYDFTETEVRELLLNGSLDALLDCLDFAPVGVIDLVKKLAVDLELSDVRKRKAIHRVTGFNVDNAIKINEESKVTDEEEDAPVRRVAVAEVQKTESTAPVRRQVTKK